MQNVVHLDQVGFIPSREARDNTTKVLNLIHVASATKTTRVFLSTDAEKAFDRINWKIMSSVRTLVWDTKCCNIYSTPSAQVKANGEWCPLRSLPHYQWHQTGVSALSPSFCLVLRTLFVYHALKPRRIGNNIRYHPIQDIGLC